MSTLAAQLGFAPDERIAVVHCDDIGMCHAANEGALAALENGPASCGSIMVPCPAFPEAAERARANPELDLGVHLTLTAEWQDYRWGPVTDAALVPSLVDDQGFLYRTALEVVQRGKPDEAAREMRAQVERALDAGIDVTHLDAHMGTALMPPFFEHYLALGREFRVPLFLAPPPGGLKGVWVTQAFAAAEAAGFPILDGFDADSLGFAPGEGAAHNAARLARLGAGVSYLICHPARGGAELSAIAPDAHARDFEAGYYGGEAGRRALDEAGIRTLGMRPLRDWLRERLPGQGRL